MGSTFVGTRVTHTHPRVSSSSRVPYSDTTKPASKTSTRRRRFRWGWRNREHELTLGGRGANDSFRYLSIPTGKAIDTDQPIANLHAFAFRNAPSLDVRDVQRLVDAHPKHFRCILAGKRKSTGTIGYDGRFALNELYSTQAAASVAHQHL